MLRLFYFDEHQGVENRVRKKILVIEDNELNRAMVSAILADDYDVLEAENGRDALDVLAVQRDSVSLILLDVVMPVMDGYTFLDTIRGDSELSAIPVIVMAQNSSEEEEVTALTHGATDFVPKPYRSQVILHRVASLIRFRETASMMNQLQYDRLTGLYSKEFFCQKVRERLAKTPDEDYVIICSDVENFKLYNDTFGREAGDRLLKQNAEALRVTMGEDGICCRYGADRFVCLRVRGQKWIAQETFMQRAFSNLPGRRSITVKWGIYYITDRAIPVDLMCDRVMLAVDCVKGHYNTLYAVYDDELRSKLLRDKAITDAMETALAEKQFTVYYQPKYSLRDCRAAGAEALVRWVHPTWGFMSPGLFVPLFEKNGFVPKLDAYVWEQVCAQLRAWIDQGLDVVPVSVNVSRADVYQDNLAETLSELVRRYGIDPALLHLEITESSYAENPKQLIRTVEEFRRYGFVMEMDDFGSGYSSLSMLSHLRLDILKLDMKFLENEMEKTLEQSILNDIISMAHRLHLRVVAEGVENEAQLQRLIALKCDYVQGYYFAKPMPAEDFARHLQADKAADA